MKITNHYLFFSSLLILNILSACAPPPLDNTLSDNLRNPNIPDQYIGFDENFNYETPDWNTTFEDPHLAKLIKIAMDKNQELNILLQEIDIAQNEASALRGEYLPKGEVALGIGGDKAGEFTRDGALEENLELHPDRPFRTFVGDFSSRINVSWEIDVWKKLRNAQQAQVLRFLSTKEGRSFMVIRLVSEIASSYYDILGLHKRLTVLKRMIELQRDALEATKLLKQGAHVTELAVQKFEAEVLGNQTEIFVIEQKILETENRLRFLIGDPVTNIEASPDDFNNFEVRTVDVGKPEDMLKNRPDIRQAELEIAASELDIKVARARFYPKIDLNASLGLETVTLGNYAKVPESLLYGVAADISAPLFNRAGIKAAYRNVSAKQIQTLYNYQRKILEAYLEVSSLVSNADNLAKSFQLKQDQVSMLNASVESANALFTTARADYLEVLLTQRDALEAELELLDIKNEQIKVMIETYQAIGGII